MLVIGHRGAAAVEPENSVAAVRRARSEGADMVEVDVRLSADDQLVVIHDATLRRVANVEAEVQELSADALRGYGIPGLEEIWDAAGGRIVVEVKMEWGTDLAVRSIGRLREFLSGREVNHAIVSSFDLFALSSLAELVALGALTHPAIDPRSAIDATAQGTFGWLFLPSELTTVAALEHAHAAGLKVVAWTVNDAAALRAFDEMGADGVITDDPGSALRVLGR